MPPYIVTHTRPTLVPSSDHRAELTLSSRAVATLDADAVRHLRSAMTGADWLGLVDLIRHLPAEGGTVGPLPDGTVIEVFPVYGTDLTDQEWCDFYNERIATKQGAT